MSNLRILIFGDDPGAIRLLKHFPISNIVGVVGATIRPQYTELLRSVASRYCVPFFVQPRPNEDEYSDFIYTLRKLSVDLMLVDSYSMILRQELLSISKLGGINIHGALLPQYRGCNPTQWAILNNEQETGVTMHEITLGIDEGKIIAQKKVPINFTDTWRDVYSRVSIATDKLIEDNISQLLKGRWNSFLQDESIAATYRRRKPEDGYFSWDEPAVDIYNKIRALLPPLPGAFYINDSGNNIRMESYMSLEEVTVQKKIQ